MRGPRVSSAGRFAGLVCFSPGEPPARLVPSVIRALGDGAPVRCTHGRQVRDYLYVEDAADALVALLDSQVVGAVNIASGQPRTVRELVAAITALFPERERPAVAFGAIAVPPDDPPVLLADVRRLADEVKWHRRYDDTTGLARTIASWRHDVSLVS